MKSGLLPSLRLALATRAAMSAFLVGAGCEAVPDLRFSDPGSDASFPVSDAADVSGDSGKVPDVGSADASGSDSASASASDSGTFDASRANACLPPNPPPSAGCCDAVLSCAGLGCAHCGECIDQGCQPNQYCCAQVSGGGKYQGIQCSADGKNCP